MYAGTFIAERDGTAALLMGISVPGALLFGVGVTVALVPEDLLPTVPLSLARGAQQMAARNALVRRLESVETLGHHDHLHRQDRDPDLQRDGSPRGGPGSLRLQEVRTRRSVARNVVDAALMRRALQMVPEHI